jgi:hypothetical protein
MGPLGTDFIYQSFSCGGVKVEDLDIAAVLNYGAGGGET